jgi:hypothetical protein
MSNRVFAALLKVCAVNGAGNYAMTELFFGT